jgi:hypothetical protein
MHHLIHTGTKRLVALAALWIAGGVQHAGGDEYYKNHAQYLSTVVLTY